MYKVYFNGSVSGWCDELVKAKLENGDFSQFYTFEVIDHEPQFLDRYV